VYKRYYVFSKTILPQHRVWNPYVKAILLANSSPETNKKAALPQIQIQRCNSNRESCLAFMTGHLLGVWWIMLILSDGEKRCLLTDIQYYIFPFRLAHPQWLYFICHILALIFTAFLADPWDILRLINHCAEWSTQAEKQSFDVYPIRTFKNTFMKTLGIK